FPVRHGRFRAAPFLGSPPVVALFRRHAPQREDRLIDDPGRNDDMRDEPIVSARPYGEFDEHGDIGIFKSQFRRLPGRRHHVEDLFLSGLESRSRSSQRTDHAGRRAFLGEQLASRALCEAMEIADEPWRQLRFENHASACVSPPLAGTELTVTGSVVLAEVVAPPPSIDAWFVSPDSSVLASTAIPTAGCGFATLGPNVGRPPPPWNSGSPIGSLVHVTIVAPFTPGAAPGPFPVQSHTPETICGSTPKPSLPCPGSTSRPASLAFTPGGRASVMVMVPLLAPAPMLNTSMPIVPLAAPSVVTSTDPLLTASVATFMFPSAPSNVTM